ncbi:Hint domain-containing protein [Planktomarina temperata]|nr:Hint domain-containing protein [Planktomarina temperata]
MTNLLTNGSFEGPHTTWTAIASGDAAGWFAVTNTQDLNRNLLGAGSATDGDDWIWFGENESLGQTLTTPLTVGTPYSLSVDLDPVTAAPTTPVLRVLDQANNVIGSVIVTTPGGYATFTPAITPVITGTEIRLEAFGNDFMSMDNANLQIACFTRGSQIKTQSGEVAIEDLAVGDRVETLDHRLQPIRWIGSSKCQATGNMAPILIRKGALGNTRVLRVSPQHRMLLSGWHAEVLFGEREVLATAKSLVNDHSILREEGGEVEYFHMLFDSHEIVYAEGAPSESFHPGAEGWKALDEPTRNEILELFPQLANGNFDSYGPSARASLKYKEGSLLSHSMISQTQH